MNSFMRNIFKIALVLFLAISFAQSKDFQVWVPDESENPALRDVVDVAVASDGTLYALLPRNVKHLDENGSLIEEWGREGDGDGEFDSPGGIAVAGDGSVYVADTYNYRIQKFDAHGNFIKKWGSNGSSDGEFSVPRGVVVDTSGNLYVVDSHNYRIQKFDSDGNFIGKWGAEGNGDGEFNYPVGIAIDGDGKVYVADSGNDRVQKFDSDGNFIGKWGSKGDGDGEFDTPYGIDIDSNGYVFVSESGNHRVQKFDSNGTFILKWGSYGSGDGEFGYVGPRNIGIDGDGNVYVADSGNDRMQKFDNDGNFLRKWGTLGSDDGLFDSPQGIAIDSQEKVYVVDTFNRRVEKFDIDGTFLLKWGSQGSGDGEFGTPVGIATDSQDNIYVSDIDNDVVQKFDSEGNFLLKWGTNGDGEGEFDEPNGIATDKNDNVYVADRYNNRIQKFDSDGNFILQWGSEGDGDGEFEEPFGVAIDSDGYVYVTDYYNYRVQKFDSDGNFIAKWGREGSGDGEFESPGFITVDSYGDIWVSDRKNYRVQRFDSSGNFIEAWGEEGAANGQFEYPEGLAVDSENTVYVVDRLNNRIQRMPMPPVEATLALKNVDLSEHNISAIRIVDAKGESEIAKFDNIEDGDNELQYKVKSDSLVYIEAIVDSDGESESWYYDFERNAFVNGRDGGVSFYKKVDFDNDTMDADAGVWIEREYDYPPQSHIVEGDFDVMGWIEILQPSQLAIDSARNILFASFYDVENDNSGIEVLDFSDPANIGRISSIEESQNSVRDILLSSCGKRLYVTRESGFYIYDVNDTSSISEIGRAFDSDYDLYEMAYDPQKSIVYILGNPSSDSTEQHIYVMDVSDPSSITNLSTIDLNTSNYYEHIHFDSDTLYVMSESVEASTYDVSDPSSPRELDFHPALSEMVVSEDGDYFYGVGIVDGYGMREIGVMRADTLDWEDSMELGDANYASMSVDADENFMYVNDGNGLIMKISLEDRANIHIEDYIHIHSQNENIDMPLNESGEYIFTPDLYGNRVSVHIVWESQLFHSDVESALDGFYELDRFRLDRSDDYLYFAGFSDEGGNGSIARVELSDASIERVIDLDFGDYSALNIFSVIDDNTFAVASDSCMMGFVDEAGDIIGELFSCPEEGKLGALTSSASTMLAYYAYEDPNGNEYIGIYNESEKLSLVPIGAKESFDSVNALYVDEVHSILYAGSSERFYAIDVSNPYRPVVLADIALENIVDIDMAPSGDILYILSSDAVGGPRAGTGGTSTITIVDVSDPGNPSKVDEYVVPEENERRVEGSSDPYRLFSGGYRNLFISDPTPSHSIPGYMVNYYWNSDFLLFCDDWKIRMMEKREDANGVSYRLRYFDAVPRLYLAQGFGNHTISLRLWDREHETLTVSTESSDESIFSVASGDGEYDAATYESEDINITIEEGDSTGLSRLDIEVSDENGKMVRSALDIVVYSILEPNLPPAAPSDFEATEINSTSVTLEWKDNADDEDGFNLYRSEEGGDFVELNNTIEPDSESYVDNTVEPGKSYRYKLVSDRDGLESDPVYTDVQTPEELPAAPTDLSADRVEAYKVELSWVDNADNEDGFNLYRSENGGEFVEINNTIEADTQSYIDETVKPDTNYTYRVVADNSAGESDASEVSVTTPDAPPKDPEDFRASSVSSHSVTLEWSDTDREKGYRIYRDGSDVSGDLPADSTSFTDDSVEENTSYKYVVKAFNDAGESDGVEITVNTTTEKPPAPSDLSADVGTDSVTLHWEDNADNEDNYVIYRNGTVIKEDLPADTESFTDSGLKEDTDYRYEVAAKNSVGESDRVSIDIHTRIDPPEAPQKIDMQADPDKVTVSWEDHSDNEKGFKIYRDDLLLDGEIPANLSTFIDDSVEEDRTYRYCVSAYNNGGESSKSCGSVRVPLSIPATPSRFEASEIYARKVTLQWKDNAGNEEYFVLKRDGQVIDDKIAADSESYTDRSVSPEHNYTYSLAARNRAGDSDYVELVVETPKDTPIPPSDLSADAKYDHVYLRWRDNSDNEDSFVLYRNGEEFNASIAPDSVDYNDSDVEEDSTYIYRLLARNSYGDSESVSVVVHTPKSVPLAPTELNATAGARFVSLNWRDNAFNEEGYAIYRDGRLIGRGVVDATSYRDDNVVPEHNYTYSVEAYNSAGYSEAATVSVKTGKDIPPAPDDFNATAHGAEVLLTWIDRSDNEKGFRLYRDGALLQTLPADSVEYLDTTTEENGHYSYELEAFNDDGESQRVKTEITTPFEISILFGRVDHTLHDIVDVAVVSKDGEVIALFHPQDGDSMESLYIVEGTEFFVKVDAKVDGGSTRSWYLNFSDSKLYKNGDGSAFLKRADISDRELRIDLGIESWPADRPELLKVPSDQVLSDAAEPVTLDIEISQSNYAALMMKVKVETLPTLTYETDWDEESWLTADEYEGRVFKLTLIPDRAESDIVTITLTDRYGNEASGSFRVTVNQTVTITAEPGEGDAPLEVNLSAVTAEEFGRVERVIWDFGDGERDEDSGVHVTHLFEEPGTYGVRVNIFNENGAHAEDRREIIVKNGNFVYHLKKGKNEISLPTRMHLDEDGLQAIFGDDAIDYLAKQSGFGWSYWDREKKPNPMRQMSRFSSLDSTEGFILYAKEDFDLALPVKEDQIEGRDDFARLYGPGWYFVGVNSDKSMKEIEALVAKQGMEVEIVEYVDQNGQMHFYTPDPEMDARTNPSIPRLDHVEREWGFYVKVK